MYGSARAGLQSDWDIFLLRLSHHPTHGLLEAPRRRWGTAWTAFVPAVKPLSNARDSLSQSSSITSIHFDTKACPQATRNMVAPQPNNWLAIRQAVRRGPGEALQSCATIFQDEPAQVLNRRHGSRPA
jgi:hypothetical protein